MHTNILLAISSVLVGLTVAIPVSAPSTPCEATAQLVDDSKKIERTAVCTATFDNCGLSIENARKQAKCTQSFGTYNVNTAGCPDDAAESTFVKVLTEAGFKCT